ncbi:MAG: tRNA uridine-5-carboxymethylaminomethyl(34) synthesis GTPase MnmE [Tannerella sp.]|nr:tRNA uridine-5-carboxymethylaminomethyl(34) synthesis GTPase MnmE [Tannerella sp.]
MTHTLSPLDDGEAPICAVSTPPGTGGIAVIRLSGKGSIVLADRVFASSSGKKLQDCAANTVHFGEIRDAAGEALDQVLVSLFRAPHSYTGEESVEISCHGSVYIQQQILRRLIDAGARLAHAGEFTQQAFLNGKMDLSQAEAVADLIASTSAGQHRLAMNQMRGGFSSELGRLREQLLDFISLVELELDFSEEDVEFADRSHLRELAGQIERKTAQLADSFQAGKAIKEGIPVAIVGETNAGKSTLLNLLVGEERALVSDIHGTTRDAIEDTVNLDGILFRFIDTAGIRQTADTIETMGIARSFRKLEQAAIVLWVIDLTCSKEEFEATARALVPKMKGKKAILLFNKSDLLSSAETEEATRQAFPLELEAERLCISAKTGAHTEKLKQLLLKAAALPEIAAGDVIISNARHYEALKKAHAAIVRVLKGMDEQLSGELLSQDIRACLHFLGEITGEITNDEILGSIFSRFCIGK